MKTSLKVKILTFLQDRLKKLPPDSKVPRWIRFVLWLIQIGPQMKLFFQGFIGLFFFRFIKDLWIVFISQKSEAKVFAGWFYRWFAVKYADKRSRISAVNKLCGGKRHYCIEYDKGSLIVINKSEMNKLKTRRLISKSYNILDVLEDAYYVTKHSNLKAGE